MAHGRMRMCTWRKQTHPAVLSESAISTVHEGCVPGSRREVGQALSNELTDPNGAPRKFGVRVAILGRRSPDKPTQRPRTCSNIILHPLLVPASSVVTPMPKLPTVVPSVPPPPILQGKSSFAHSQRMTCRKTCPSLCQRSACDSYTFVLAYAFASGWHSYASPVALGWPRAGTIPRRCP